MPFSTKNFAELPKPADLLRICKAISVLDAILSPEWEYRYYSFNAKWDTHEQCLQMRDGSGDEMLILFSKEGCVINGFAHEFPQPDKAKLTAGLPVSFHEFIFGEPIQTIGTTFCLWFTNPQGWQTGHLESFEDNSIELLEILDGQAQTYIDWASEYFEDDDMGTRLSLEVVQAIYAGQVLTKAMVRSIVNAFEDWNQLEADLQEIDYPYDFKAGPQKPFWKIWK